MWTKRKLIEAAFDELALAGYVYDLTPEELQAALRRLETMLATWAAQGLHLSYNFGDASADLDDASGLALVAVEAVYLQLAVRLSASKGKQLSRTTITTARAAYDGLLASDARDKMRPQQYRDGLVKGGGNRSRIAPFIHHPTTSPAPDGLDFLGN